MDVDWLADVRKYVPDADEGVVGKIIRYCGIALRTPNAASVTFSDKTETDRVRENYLKKKLGLTHDDATLDDAIAATGQRMGIDEGYRVTVYYLLAEHFDLLNTFGGTKTGTINAEAASVTAAALSVAGTSAAVSGTSTAPPHHAPSTNNSANHRRSGGSGDGIVGIGCIAGLVMLGAVIFAALVAIWAQSTILADDPETSAVTAPAAPAAEPPEPQAAEAPEGAGVTATERDGKPLLTVYFDSGSTEVTADFEAVSTTLRDYLSANPDANVQISGFNDPTGNAQLNAELSKNRAENVQAQLIALGLEEERTELVKPDDTTSEELSNAEARRVEITIVE